MSYRQRAANAVEVVYFVWSCIIVAWVLGCGIWGMVKGLWEGTRWFFEAWVYALGIK